jgi:DNA-binding MarR family transcriptional regulator
MKTTCASALSLERCLLIPSYLIDHDDYRELGSEAKILYSQILEEYGLTLKASRAPFTVKLSDINTDELADKTCLSVPAVIYALYRLKKAGLVSFKNAC